MINIKVGMFGIPKGNEMDKLACIKLFCDVARLGSFTAAANELNMTQGAVSKKIAWLETNLGFNLFNRNSRKIMLTEAGSDYLEFAKNILESFTITEQTLKGQINQVVGKIRISAPSAFASERLAKPISEFMVLNPKLVIEVSVNDKQVDLFEENIDIAIRASLLRDSALKAKKLMNHQLSYIASPKYLELNGKPSKTEDLATHSCITYSLSNPSNVWHINEQKVAVNEVLSSDSPQMIVAMAKLGTGIAGMPRWMVEKDLESGQLVELFPGCSAPALPMYAVYKSSDYLPYRIRAFIDFLSVYFEEN